MRYSVNTGGDKGHALGSGQLIIQSVTVLSSAIGAPDRLLLKVHILAHR